MKVYILVAEGPEHREESVCGVYSSLQGAMDAHPADWSFNAILDAMVAPEDNSRIAYRIDEHEVV